MEKRNTILAQLFIIAVLTGVYVVNILDRTNAVGLARLGFSILALSSWIITMISTVQLAKTIFDLFKSTKV